MDYYEMMLALKNDLDDDNNIQTYYFKEIDCFEYLHRGLRYINEKLKIASKFHFLTLQPYIDSYALPADYISFKKMVDLTEQVVLPYSKYNSVRSKYTTDTHYMFTTKNNMFEVDESLRKIYFDRVPDEHFGFQYQLIASEFIAGAINYVTFDDVCYSLTRERAGGVATITVDDEHHLRVGDTVEISNMGGSDYNTSLATITAISSTSFSYACSGADEVTTADTNGIVFRKFVNYNDPVIIKVVNDPAIDNSFMYCRVSLVESYGTLGKKMYLSEVDILGQGIVSDPFYVEIVDYAMEYIYEPEAEYAIGTGTVTIPANDATASFDNITGISVGCGIYIPGYGMKVVESITAGTAPAGTVEFTEVFSQYKTITAMKFYIMNCLTVPRIPVEFHEMMVIAGKYYAFMRESRHDLVAQQKGILDGAIKEAQARQIKETIKQMNDTDRGYDAGVETFIPPRWNF